MLEMLNMGLQIRCHFSSYNRLKSGMVRLTMRAVRMFSKTVGMSDRCVPVPYPTPTIDKE